MKGSQDTSEPQSLIHTPGHWQVEELHGLSPEEQFSNFPWNPGYLEGLLKQIIEPPPQSFWFSGSELEPRIGSFASSQVAVMLQIREPHFEKQSSKTT